MKKVAAVLLSIVVIAAVILGCRTLFGTKEYPGLYTGIDYHNNDAFVYTGTSVRNQGKRWINYGEEPENVEQNAADIWLDDSDLQKEVRKIRPRGKLDNDEAIKAFSWKLQPILQKHGYLPEDCFPVSANHYQNGVIEIVFSDQTFIDILENNDWGKIYDFQISALVAEKDGHIIFVYSSMDGEVVRNRESE